MRDQERIEAYYNFGTMDCVSESFKKKKSGKNNLAFKALRPLKFAALVWINVFKDFSSVKK